MFKHRSIAERDGLDLRAFVLAEATELDCKA
jgi:hypothetical protein